METSEEISNIGMTGQICFLQPTGEPPYGENISNVLLLTLPGTLEPLGTIGAGMELIASPLDQRPDDVPSCYGLFTCISRRCKACPSSFDCSRDSGSKVAFRMMVKAKMSSVNKCHMKGLDCRLTIHGKIVFQ